MNSLKHLLYITLVSTLFISCAKQNAFFLKQGYHDVTSNYNAYFNANELYKLTVKSIEDSRKENFDEILPLYAYGTTEDTKAHEAEFTTVINKSTESIQLHKISNWADDHFLMLGKAFYMQGEYKKAEESLRYVTANFKDGVDGRSEKKFKKDKNNKKLKAKAKKLSKKNIQKIKDGKDIRPRNSIFVHEPTKTNALIWLTKTYIANKEYHKASSVLDYMDSDNGFIQNYDKDKEITYAYYYIEQKQYSDAIKHIEKALSEIKGNKKKARLRYVMAQLLEKTNNKKDAASYYLESTKGNSNYDMVFNAKLNGIKLSNGSSSDKEDRLLAKLIRDSKNEDYLDQLYYERALISLKNEDEPSALKFLNLSVENSKDNKIQKAKSHLLLAEIFYSNVEYGPSQENYAACLSLIDESHENYKTIFKRATVLTDLITQLNLITLNDSLLIIAEIPQEELEELLYQQAVSIIDEQQKKSENLDFIDKFAGNDRKTRDTKWYFYSSNAKTLGFTNFKLKWGDRKLEDNWRRENKNSSSGLAEDPKTEEELYEEKVNSLYETMLANIPNSDSTKMNFKNDIVTAHYNAANIYKYDLENNKEAIAHYSVITEKYLNSSYDAESLFNLYLLNKKLDYKTASNTNKNLVLSKYPKSKYAKIINNPSYTASNNKTKNVETYYEETYNTFIKEDYKTVIEKILKSKNLFPSNKLEAKFALLEAITLGKQKKYKPYVDGLEYVISTFKNSVEEEKATEMLAYLKGDFPKKDTKPTDNSVIVDPNVSPNPSTNDIFDKDAGKDKEGFKVKFGKKDILKVGTNESEPKKDSKIPGSTPSKKPSKSPSNASPNEYSPKKGG